MIKLPYDNDIKTAGEVNDIFNEDQRLKSSLLKVWKQNIHFLNGQQTMEWDQYQRKFQNVPVLNNRSNRPQIYVTNEIEPIVRTLVSFLTRNKPKARCYPSEPNNDSSVRRAKMGELVTEATWDIDREYDKYTMAAYWLLTLGTVIRKDYWDASARGQIHFNDAMPDMFENQMSGEDFMGGAGIPQDTQNLTNGFQPPTTRNWGDMASAILTPLQFAVDFTATEFTQADWVEEYSLQNVDWMREQYGKKGPGYTGRINDLKAQENFGKALEEDLRFRFATPMISAAKPEPKNMCVMKELYHAPKADMPWNQNTNAPLRGRLIVVGGDVLLYDGPSPYLWHPYTCAIYEPFLGRFWGKSLVEQLVSLQRRLNEINGVILENSQTMANPQWLVYEGSVREGSISGKGGLIVNWNSSKGQTIPPNKLDGTPLPQQYFQEKAGIIDQMVRIAGTNAILQGQAPSGVTAAASLQLMLENAQSQHGPLLNNWELFIERSQTKKLQNFQRFSREPRQDLVQYLRRLDHDVTELDVVAITGDMLEDNVSVAIEAGSSIPKSQAARQSQLMELAKMGALGDIIKDPITNQQFLSEFGITEFNKSTNAEWEKIKWEDGRMLQGKPPSPSPNDQHELHLPSHTAETQKPSFIEGASPQVKKIFEDHIAWHKEQESKAMQAQEESQTEALEMQGKFELMKENLKKAPVFDPMMVNQLPDLMKADVENSPLPQSEEQGPPTDFGETAEGPLIEQQQPM